MEHPANIFHCCLRFNGRPYYFTVAPSVRVQHRPTSRCTTFKSNSGEMRRLADPYRDLDVIDSRAPRFNQATIGTLAALSVATGWWWLLAVLAAQLWIGLSLGRRFCIPCLAYFQLVQPRFGEGPLEDSRPPRFANLVGAVFLSAAAGFYAAQIDVVGAVLGGLVAGLALLAAATGFCTGCEAYKLGRRLLGRPFISCPVPPRPANWAN